jgi:hypothetical protein
MSRVGYKLARDRVLSVLSALSILIGAALMPVARAAPIYHEAVSRDGGWVFPDHASADIQYFLPHSIGSATGTFLRTKLARRLYQIDFDLSPQANAPSGFRALPCVTRAVSLSNLDGALALSTQVLSGPGPDLRLNQRVTVRMGIKKNLEQFLMAMGAQGTLELDCQGYGTRPESIDKPVSWIRIGLPIDAEFTHWYYR